MGAIKNIGKGFKGFIIWFFIILGGISAVITIAVFRKEVWQVVTAIVKFLISTDGRQLILSLLVIGLIILLVRLNRRIKTSSPSKEKGAEGDVKKLRDDLGEQKLIHTKVTQKLDKDIREIRQSLSQIYDKAKKYEQIEIKPEYIYILKALGARLDKTLTQARLYRIFSDEYIFNNDEETNLNFNLIIEWLERKGYINKEEIDDEDGWIETFYEITTNGFEYLRIAEIKKEEEKKKIEEEEKKSL